jgi:hypothetical protein
MWRKRNEWEQVDTSKHWIIEDIKNLTSAGQTEEEIKSRVGCTVCLAVAQPGEAARWEYLKNNQGQDKSGPFGTTEVLDVELAERREVVLITTMNSRYTLRQVYVAPPPWKINSMLGFAFVFFMIAIYIGVSGMLRDALTLFSSAILSGPSLLNFGAFGLSMAIVTLFLFSAVLAERLFSRWQYHFNKVPSSKGR